MPKVKEEGRRFPLTTKIDNHSCTQFFFPFADFRVKKIFDVSCSLDEGFLCIAQINRYRPSCHELFPGCVAVCYNISMQTTISK